ncbi:MAG: DUF2254 domain-containing protein, partial [Candidatus Sumerlaeota bacterium]
KNDWMLGWPRLFGAGPAGARGMLSTIAGSMMTVVGVTFSMTLVTLVLASSQYTSRILRNFMRDRVTQIVLGIFAGIFTYCLIVLRTIRGSEEFMFIPSMSVTFGFLIAIFGIHVLIFFIHHIASSIQASNIIASVANDTMDAIDRLFPEKIGEAMPDESDTAAEKLAGIKSWVVIPSSRYGYIQSVDHDSLIHFARKQNAIIRMERGIGEFIVDGAPLLSVSFAGPSVEEAGDRLRGAYSIHRFRTIEQDAAFGIRQIVDIALRALSPGTNDTTTAVMCIDYLTAISARAAKRTFPPALRFEDRQLRVVAIGPSFASILGESLDQIRGSAQGNIAVMEKMIEFLEVIGGMTQEEERRTIILDHINMIDELAVRTIAAPLDRTRVLERISEARQRICFDG